MLVIGAGTGNDVSVALSEGAKHVDAVEIDPDLVQLGKEYNPDHAYQSPRVSVHIDDGRAFLQNTDQHYSLILYALPDSLTALTGQAAPVGLENYLLTIQAIQEAKAHLEPGGHLRHVQLLPTVPAQPVRNHPRRGVRLAALRPARQHVGRPPAGRTDRRLDGKTPNCSSLWNGTPPCTGLRQPTVPLSARPPRSPVTTWWSWA